MSITAQNIAYMGSASMATAGNTVFAFGGSDMQDLAYRGIVTFTGDGSTTSAIINYVDGTNGLGFNASAVTVQRIGGNAANSIVMYSADNADNTAVVTFSSAPGSTTTVKLLVTLYKNT